jgi:hypothetical protein
MSRGAAVLRGVLAAQQTGANAIPWFFGENRTFDGEAGPALAVSICSDTALWMIARCVRSMTSAHEGSHGPRVASAAPVQSGDRSRRWLVR